MVGAAPDERAKFAQRAAEDWEKILLARAAEMKSGSQFIVLNFGIDEQDVILSYWWAFHVRQIHTALALSFECG